jgi:hypothetical protein
MGALDGSIKIPGMGDIPKKHAAIAAASVAGIVGIGYYRKRQADAAASAAGIDSGITEGTSDAFGDSSPIGPGDLSGGGAVSTGGDPLPAPINLQNPGILTNSDWKSAATGIDLGGTDSSVIAAACSKAIGGIPMTQAEVEIFNEVSGEIGYPPQGYPPIRLTTSTPGNTPPAHVPVWQWRRDHVQLTHTTGARALIQQHATPGATATQVEEALRKTVADPANRAYAKYYGTSHGNFPAKANLYITVPVKK